MTGVEWTAILIGAFVGTAGALGASLMAKVAKRKRHPHCPDEITTAELFFVWSTLMAKLNEVQDSIAKQTQAIIALGNRIPAPQPPPAATEADLDGLKQGIDSNTALIDGLAPPQS